MILRLRRVGIDFKTSMLAPPPPNQIKFHGRDYGDAGSGNVHVRTDSYFTEPGFMSIFAHGCAGPEKTTKLNRINSKMPIFRDPVLTSSSGFHNNQFTSSGSVPERQRYQRRFWYPIREGNAEHRRRSDTDYERKLEDAESMENDEYNVPLREWHQIETNDHRQSDEIASAFLRELESLFSKGAQGILTSYIQRMLQPAIKNTLMEGMGYTISYG